MKTFVRIFFMVCSLNFVSAQIDSTVTAKRQFEFGVRSGFYYTDYSNGFNYFANLTARNGIHEFSFGPSFGKSPSFYYPFEYHNYYGPRKFNGIDFSYRILPNGTGKIFDFYFQFNYFQKWGSGMAIDYIHNFPNLYDQTPDNVEIRSVASILLLEYGFDIKFLKYFYLGTSIGIGGKFDFRRYNYEVYEQFSYGEVLKDLDFIYRANLGFRF